MPSRWLDVLLDPALFWSIFGTYESEPITFERWQLAHLRDNSRLRAREKAPQIGFSWLCALEAVHEAMFFEDATTAFVSVGLSDANEKVTYARKAYSELPEAVQTLSEMTKDTTDELYFGKAARASRIFSVPATSAMRGKKMSVYLDEVDFYRDGGHEALRAALGRITRGGRVTMGSTCFGVDTSLDKVMHGEGGKFSRSTLPWTVATNQDIIDTILLAKAELDPEDFAEEYECVRGGSTSDTFPAGLIRNRMGEQEPVDPLLYDSRSSMVAGYDVGKSRHPSVLTILERQGDRWAQRVLYQVVDEQGGHRSLPQQHEFLRDLLRRLRTLTLVLDVAGIGAHTGQALVEEFGESRIIMLYPGSKPPNMPSQDKAELVTELKRALEADELELVPDREQAMQFRRTRIVTGGRIDQPGSKKKTHYDRFWSTAYAWYGTHAGGTTVSAYQHHGLVVVGGRRERAPWE